MTLHARRRALLLSAAAAAGLSVLPARRLFAQPASDTPRLDVPYVPTSQVVVDRMLDVAKVGRNDVLYDLGCGDGRIVVTAAKKHGAHGTGIDLNPERIAEARQNAKQAGVESLVNFQVGNLFEVDVVPATVVTLYLLPSVNLKLRPRLWQQLKVGTRVVSHDFDMGKDWPPQQTVEVDGAKIYLWTITQAQKKSAKT
jgi:SAM-dependent methyltransferase